MTDYFAVLEQPRRPWVDADALKQAYYRLTLRRHPDTHTSSGDDNRLEPAALNDAYRVLQNPKLRIQHLLALEGGEPVNGTAGVRNEVADLFWDAGNLSKQIGAVLSDAATVTTDLAQSLLKRRASELERRTKAMVGTLDRLYEQCLAELRTLDAQWDENRDAAALRQLHHRLTYLTRWIGGFREELFRLSQVTTPN